MKQIKNKKDCPTSTLKIPIGVQNVKN